jgi:hypothetical protein
VRNGEPAFGGGSRQSQYVRCNFDGANLRHFGPGVARFERCSFLRVIISDCHSLNAEFVECVFSGRIRDTVFWARDWLSQESRKNEFVRNDFSQCVLDGVSFRGGISVGEQRLPEVEQYLYVDDLAAALDHVRRRRPDPKQRRLHKVITTTLSSHLATGQFDALYEPRRFGESPHESAIATQWLREACGLLPPRVGD